MLEIAAFALTVAAALFFHWEAKDLIWGLWISSFSVGYAYILRIIITGVIAQARSVPWPAAIIGGMFFLVFFTFHFGFFHIGHSIFLSLFFPLIPMDRSNFPNVSATISICLTHYWPVILGTLMARLPDFFAPIGEFKDMGKQMHVPYVSVVKIHLLIFVFAGMSIVHVTRFAMYPILIFFFFPFNMFKRRP